MNQRLNRPTMKGQYHVVVFFFLLIILMIEVPGESSHSITTSSFRLHTVHTILKLQIHKACSNPIIISRPLLLQSLSLEAPARVKNKAPPSDWPQEGEIVFDNVEMKYREDLPVVLKKLSCTIRPKEKVGIVGRTGSG